MEVRLLGEVEAWRGRCQLDLGPRQQRLVLAVLALEVGRTVPVDRLVELLWPQGPPKSARSAVQVRVSQLRAVLGAYAALRGGSDGYQLEMDPEHIDVHRFRSLAGRAQAAGDVDAVGLYRSALELWRGPALSGTITEDSVRGQLCTSLEEARMLAYEDCLERELRLGEHERIVTETAKLTRAHPERERLLAHLMIASYRCGRTEHALQVYAGYRDRLADELGLDPGTAVRELEAAILREDPDLRWAPAASSGRAHTAYDVEAGGSRGREAPAQLPSAPVPFTGRDRQRAELNRLLPTDDDTARSRLVVLTGPAAVGKTALAIEWGHRVAEHFPDGQLFVDLRGHTDGAVGDDGAEGAEGAALNTMEAITQLLRGVGVDTGATPSDIDEAAAWYRSLTVDLRLLVVLDNAADPDQVRPLVPAAPASLTIVTSRDRLSGLIAREGADRIPLHDFAADESEELLAHVLGAARTKAEPDAVVHLAQACEGRPLAVRLAAAQLAADPQHRLADFADALTGRAEAGQPGRTTDPDPSGRTTDDAPIRRAFDLADQSLDNDLHRALRLLARIPGSDWTVETAAAVLATPETETRSILHRLSEAALIIEYRTGRFRLHDLLRAYARTRDAAGVVSENAGQDAAEDRAASYARLLGWYYLNLREATVRLRMHHGQLDPPALPDGLPTPVPHDEDSAQAWIDQEYPNLIDAITEPVPAAHAGMVCHLAFLQLPIAQLRGRTNNKRALCEVVLQAAEATGDAVLQATACATYGAFLSERDPNHALRMQREGLEYAERSNHPSIVGLAVHDIGATLLQVGELLEARAHFTRALELQPFDEGFHRTYVLINLATTAEALGRFAEAREYAEDAVDHSVEHAPHVEPHALALLAQLQTLLGQPSHAAQLLDRARVAAGAHDSTVAVTLVELRQAQLALLRGDTARAAASAEGCAQRFRELGNRSHATYAINLLGQALRHGGNPDGAMAQFVRARELAAELGARGTELEALIGIASCHTALHEPAPARGHANHAAEAASTHHMRELQARAIAALAELEFTVGRLRPAIEQARAALALHQQTGHHVGQAHAAAILGQALLAENADPQEGKAQLARAQQMYAAVGAPEAGTLTQPLRATDLD